MTLDDALAGLAIATAEAMSGVLEQFCPGAVTNEPPVIAEGVAEALADPPLPGLAASVAYVDGVTGGNVFLIPTPGAHRLATAMMGGSPEEEPAPGPLTELELSAIGEAMNQMMAAAAAATSRVLGYEVEIAPPETMPTDGDQLVKTFTGTTHATTTVFEVCGAPCRYVQLVPHAFVVRLTRAIDERGAKAPEPGSTASNLTRDVLRESLSATSVRVSAEIGRTHMQVDRLIGIPDGTVIELDREADEPIDIYVNGRRFALGRLVVTDTDDWAVRVERVLPADPPER